MPLDPQYLPISGSALVAGIAYAAVSYLVTGPEIGERMIVKSEWGRRCEAALIAEVESRRTPAKIIPRTDCNSLLGGLMPELSQLCMQYGNPDFGGPTTEIMREQERRRQEAEANKLALAAAKSGSRCECASAVFVEENRVSLAVFAGSARLVTPAAIENLDAGLVAAVHAPQCALKSE